MGIWGIRRVLTLTTAVCAAAVLVMALVPLELIGFMLFGFCAGLLVLAYTLIPITDTAMLFIGFPLGFFLSGVFSGMGAFLSELFPSRVRGSAQGFCYNFGRATGAVCPALVRSRPSST